MRDLKEICLNYFRRFEAKDLAALESIFSENVNLQDWENQAEGKEAVLAVNENIFSQALTIKVIPMRLYQECRSVIAELEIIINNASTPLKVVDVIVFDESNCICAIRAYRG